MKSGTEDPDYQVRIYKDGLGRETFRIKTGSDNKFTRSGTLRYDAAGRLVSRGQTEWTEEEDMDTYRFVNEQKNPTFYEYDAVGRIKKTTLPRAEGETKATTIINEYNDPWELIQKHSGGKNKKTKINAREHTLYVEDYGTGDDGTSIRAKMGFCYDLAGNKIKKSDLNTGSMSCPTGAGLSANMPGRDSSGNNHAYWNYDAFGQLKAASDPDMGVSTYTYNAFGDLTQLTDAENRSTSYSYDRLGA